jgi:DNA-binding NtrC family response regulator
VPPSAPRLKDHERAAARRVLDECGGNKKRAAEQLGISRSYLYKLLA